MQCETDLESDNDEINQDAENIEVITDTEQIIKKPKPKTKKKDPKKYIFKLGIWLVNLAVLALFCFVCLNFIPTIEIKSELLNYWHGGIAFSNFVYLIIVQIFGFCYVSGVTNNRKNPFLSRRKNYREIIKLTLATPVIFIIGPSITLKSSLQPISVLDCFLFNFFSFTIGVYIGLLWTYLDKVPLLAPAADKFTTPALWNTCKLTELLAFVPALMLIFGIVGYHIYLMIMNKVLFVYLLLYIGSILILIGITFLIRKRYYLHMHHYLIFSFLIPLTTFQNSISATVQGIFLGIYIEGISTWSFANLFYKGTRNPIN